MRVRLPASEAKEPSPKVILFLSARDPSLSRIAESFARPLANGAKVYSASMERGGIHPAATQVMAEACMDVVRQESGGLDSVPFDQVDLLITLTAETASRCPALPAGVKRIDWSLADPVMSQGNEEDVEQLFREVRDDLRARVHRLFTMQTN